MWEERVFLSCYEAKDNCKGRYKKKISACGEGYF